MTNVYLSYIDLSPELENPMVDATHQPILQTLRIHFPRWQRFARVNKGLDLGFIVVTELGNHRLSVKGPTLLNDTVDFSFFLPDSVGSLKATNVHDVVTYLNWIFQGISEAISMNVDREDIETAREECLLELGIEGGTQ